MKILDLTAIVTGGAGGMGRHFCLGLCRAGAKVAAFDVNPEGLAALDLAVVTHAEEGARRFLVGLFATDGYTVEVDFAPVARQAAPAAR